MNSQNYSVMIRTNATNPTYNKMKQELNNGDMAQRIKNSGVVIYEDVNDKYNDIQTYISGYPAGPVSSLGDLMSRIDNFKSEVNKQTKQVGGALDKYYEMKYYKYKAKYSELKQKLR